MVVCTGSWSFTGDYYRTGRVNIQGRGKVTNQVRPHPVPKKDLQNPVRPVGPGERVHEEAHLVVSCSP